MPIRVISYNCPECKRKFAFEDERDKHFEQRHVNTAAERILGFNMWNSEIVDNHSRVLGHKPDLEDYDRMCR